MPDLSRLQKAVEGFSSTRIFVVGDLMLDRFVWGEVSRISPEAPVPVVHVQKETILLGGAANVASNIRAMDGGCMLGGMTGSDDDGRQLLSLARSRDIDISAVMQDNGPTTVKTRIVARGQQVVRVDREEIRHPAGEVLEKLSSAFGKHASRADCVIVSDYAKGIISHDTMTSLVQAALKSGTPVLVDPKPSNMDMYHNVTMLTPNSIEAREMTGMEIEDDTSLSSAAKRIMSNLNAGAVLITRGAQGMGLMQKGRELFTVPAMAREVFDVTGAGDTVIATFAMGIANGLEMTEAAWLANVAAGIVVGKVGTATAGTGELLDALEALA